jgi:hypothetical protein
MRSTPWNAVEVSFAVVLVLAASDENDDAYPLAKREQDIGNVLADCGSY